MATVALWCITVFADHWRGMMLIALAAGSLGGALMFRFG